RPPDPRQRAKRFRVARKASAVLRDYLARRAMREMCAAVVAEAAPQFEHALDWRCRKARHVRKRGEEALVIWDHGRDLRLLQHDLGEPDAVRIARTLPGKIAPAEALLPSDQALREGTLSGQAAASPCRRLRR